MGVLGSTKLGRGRWFPLAMVVFGGMVPCFGDESPDANSRMNCLLITADDLGIQLGCYGDRQAVTPRLDGFASDAVRFEVAYVAQASCSPSRSAMLTGWYPHTNGQIGLANALGGLPPDQRFAIHPHLRDQTLVNRLHDAGYFTGCIGKLHINPEKSFKFDRRYKDGFGDRRITRQWEHMRTFLDEAGDRPFFLMANVFDPHVEAVTQNGRRTGTTRFPKQVDGVPKHPRTADNFEPFPFQRIDHPKMMRRVANYYNCVERADAGIGGFLDVLNATGHADDTVVIVLGDHGPPVCRGKTTCYEAGLRVPFLVRWPGVTHGSVSDRMVSAVDIAPTFYEAAHVRPADGLHGRSLRPILSAGTDEAGDDAAGGPTGWRAYLVAEFHYHGDRPYYPRRAVRDDRYKLIWNVRSDSTQPHRGVDGCPAASLANQLPEDSKLRQVFARMQNPPEWELYDLTIDPWEMDNIADQPGMRGVKDRLFEALSRWREQTGDHTFDVQAIRHPEAS